MLEEPIRPHVYAIYGMVRLADEIVDTFMVDTNSRLEAFRQAVHSSLREKFSANPVLQAFQKTYHTFGIDPNLIDAFFLSMAMDIDKKRFTRDEYEIYVYGSAEAVGLMCLAVFVRGDKKSYTALSNGAQRLGAAYQKINFLRDIQADFTERGRIYFPELSSLEELGEGKQALEVEAREDLAQSRAALKQLPRDARLGVELSARYYAALLHKIEQTSAEKLLKVRIRIPNWQKMLIFLSVKLGA